MNAPKDVRLIILPEELHAYLTFVFRTHCTKGLEPGELVVASELFRRIDAAPTVDFSQLGKVKLENLSPSGVTISTEPDPGCTAETGEFIKGKGYTTCGKPIVRYHPEHNSNGPVNLCEEHEAEHALVCTKPHCTSGNPAQK